MASLTLPVGQISPSADAALISADVAASPWFSTHYGPEVSYSKNWIFPADLLWYNRWAEILDLAPQYVEIITWNDYGESHYIGPLSSPHVDDGGSKWVNDMYVTADIPPLCNKSIALNSGIQAARRLARNGQAIHRRIQGWLYLCRRLYHRRPNHLLVPPIVEIC